MAITTTGGSGSGSVAIAAKGSVNQTLFTTPNTTNAIFLITITWGVSWSGTNAPMVVCGGYGSNPITGSAGSGTMSPLHMKVGPNTAVIVSWGEVVNLAGTINYSWNWVGVVVT